MSGNICNPSKSIGSNPALKASSLGNNSDASNEPDILAIAVPMSLAKSCPRKSPSSTFGPIKMKKNNN